METEDIREIESYWSAQPCNVRHSSAPVGSAQWSKEVACKKYWIESHIPGFAQFNRWAAKRVLEIGSGIGTDTLEFLYHGARVDAVDLSGKSVAIARERCKGFFPLCGDVYQADAEQWLPAGLYDLVYSFGVLHHTPHPERVVAKVAERLKYGGEFRFMVYARRSWKHWTGAQPEAQAGCPLVRWYTAREVRKLVEPYGFKVTSIRKTHIFPWKIEEYKRNVFVKEWWWKLVPGPLFRLLERLIGHHLLVVCKRT